MSRQVDYQKLSENNHRRTFSNNLDNIKGIKAGHRRTMSNTAYDFAGLNMISPPVTKEDQLTTESLKSPFKIPQQKKKRGFVSLINAAISYFNQEAQFPINFPPSEIDILKAQLEKLKTTYKDIEQNHLILGDDCEKIKKKIEEQQKNKKSLEMNINELKKYATQLDNTARKVNSDIKLEKKRNDDLQFMINEQEKVRYSPQNLVLAEGDKRIKKKNSDIDRPMPRPITYKPITQRGIRNSREMSKK